MNLIFRNHALKRMFERDIDIEDVRQAIETGKIIADYLEDQTYPSRLLGWKNNQPLHVVCADNENSDVIVITAYYPDPLIWNNDFTRKK